MRIARLARLGLASLALALPLAVGAALRAGAHDSGAPHPHQDPGTAGSCLGLARLRGEVFAPGGTAIRDEVKPVLDLIATAIKERCTGKKILIEGHTDVRGSAEANLALSEKRAAAVKAYLVEKGVPAEQLDTKGFGETRPLTPKTSAAADAVNRRVTFRVEGE